MRRPNAFLLAVLIAGATACGGGDAAGPATVSGTYTLQTVNGSPLPFTTSQDATYKAEILSWVVTLNDDLHYTYVFRGRSTDNGQVDENTIESDGTYSVNGTSIRMFDPSDNSYLDATIVQDGLTVAIDGPAGVFNLKFTR